MIENLTIFKQLSEVRESFSKKKKKWGESHRGSSYLSIASPSLSCITTPQKQVRQRMRVRSWVMRFLVFFFFKYKILNFKYSYILFCLVRFGSVHYGTKIENIQRHNTCVTFSNARGTYKQHRVHGQEMYSCSLF